MAVIEIKKAAGLVTQPNELDTVPGALTRAENVDITRDGVIEVARGFEDYSTNLPDFTPEQLFVFDGVAYLHLDDGIWYNTGSGWFRKKGNLGSILGYYGACYLAGSIYICNPYYTIDKIDLATGLRTTIAGRSDTSGTADGTGDAARFTSPRGICTDGTNLWVTDNHAIRKLVISSGVVTTFAGTAGTTGTTDATGSAARFNIPNGIVMSGTDLYVADYVNDSIRKITSGAVVTTFAGLSGTPGTTDATGTSARFNGPSGITMIGTDFYVTDNNNDSIRKITSGAVVTTFAGLGGTGGTADGTGGAARFDDPAGIVAIGTDLYVADYTNCTIRKITSGAVVTTPFGTAGSTGTTDAVGTAARFQEPSFLLSDGTDLYVTEDYNQSLRKIYMSTSLVVTIDGGIVTPSGAPRGSRKFVSGIIAGPT